MEVLTTESMHAFLLQRIRSRLNVDPKFTDQLLEMNLLYFFVQDDHSALDWVNEIEERFDIKIPDIDADFFFLSDINHMISVIARERSKKQY